MDKRFAIIFGIVIAIFLGVLIFNKDSAEAPSTASQPTNHTYSQGSSGVTLVEYGDFNCRACYSFYPIVKEVKEKYKDTVTFQFRHLPLVEIHLNALVGARAAEAASLQGKFWEMHDKLFENFPEWEKSNNTTPLFERYAQEIGLDVAKFGTDLRSEAVNQSVQADRAEAKRKNYSSTPTFELDGKQLDSSNLRTVEAFSQVIDEAIAAKKQQ